MYARRDKGRPEASGNDAAATRRAGVRVRRRVGRVTLAPPPATPPLPPRASTSSASTGASRDRKGRCAPVDRCRAVGARLLLGSIGRLRAGTNERSEAGRGARMERRAERRVVGAGFAVFAVCARNERAISRWFCRHDSQGAGRTLCRLDRECPHAQVDDGAPPTRQDTEPLGAQCPFVVEHPAPVEHADPPGPIGRAVARRRPLVRPRGPDELLDAGDGRLGLEADKTALAGEEEEGQGDFGRLGRQGGGCSRRRVGCLREMTGRGGGGGQGARGVSR